MEINLTGYQLVAGVAVVCLFLIGIIQWSRWYYRRSHRTTASSKPSERTKYNAYNVLRNSAAYFRVGLACSMVITLLAFSWTTYEKTESVSFTFDPGIDLDQVPPIVHPPKPKIQKPPPPVVIEVPEEPIETDESPTFIDTELDETPPEPPAPPAPKAIAPPKPVAPPPPAPKEPEFVIMAEEMPRICTSCETQNLSRKEKNTCAGNEMLKFVQSNVKYPSLAREVGVEGVCAVRFRINPDGSLSNIELLKDIGAGCGKESLRATKLLQEQCWLPGKQNGRPVAVQMTLPIRFKLQ